MGSFYKWRSNEKVVFTGLHTLVLEITFFKNKDFGTLEKHLEVESQRNVAPYFMRSTRSYHPNMIFLEGSKFRVKFFTQKIMKIKYSLQFVGTFF